jgi:tetratricopeptide (TPR) repeat protein
VRTLLLLVVLVPFLATAQSKNVKKYMNAAITMYENLEYEKALKQLKKAREKANGPDDEGVISLLEGAVLADMGKEEKATDAFKAGFSIDPEAKLPVDVSPKVSHLAEKVRAQVKKLLAPQIEQEKALEEKRLAEEKRAADEREKARLDEEARLAEQRRAEAEKNKPPPAVVKPVETGGSVRKFSWIPGAVGLAAAGVGTYFLVSASGKYTALNSGTAPSADAAAMRDSGKTDQTVGMALVGVGAAGVAAAIVMFAVGGPSSTGVAVVPTRDGALFTVQGTF